jgi:hypothetical protein
MWDQHQNIFIKMAVFCDIAPCNLVETDRRFRGAYCLHHPFETSVGYCKIHGAISQKTDIFILAAVRVKKEKLSRYAP